MSDHPHTREAIERWQQGKINVFDALAELEDQRDEAVDLYKSYRESVENYNKELDSLEKERDAAQAECLEQARLLGMSAEREADLRSTLDHIRAGYQGTCYACELVGEMNQEYRDAARELIRLLDIEEESDSGTVFHPNKISSCRVMDGARISQCLKKLKELSR
jgi:chromosome segregation ATPase